MFVLQCPRHPWWRALAWCHFIPGLQGHFSQVEAPRCVDCPRHGACWSRTAGGATRVRPHSSAFREAGLHAPLLPERQFILLGSSQAQRSSIEPARKSLITVTSFKSYRAARNVIALRVYLLVSFFSQMRFWVEGGWLSEVRPSTSPTWKQIQRPLSEYSHAVSRRLTLPVIGWLVVDKGNYSARPTMVALFYQIGLIRTLNSSYDLSPG